jgi:hypothetical protein
MRFVMVAEPDQSTSVPGMRDGPDEAESPSLRLDTWATAIRVAIADADRRDLAAAARDRDARARDEAARRRDHLAEMAERSGVVHDAAADRLAAARDRQAAFADRHWAAVDRDAAAGDRALLHGPLLAGPPRPSPGYSRERCEIADDGTDGFMANSHG